MSARRRVPAEADLDLPGVPLPVRRTPDDGLAVHLRFRRERYLLEVDFTAPAGVTVLVGPSGTGKSTTLDLLAGHLVPEEGLVLLRGEVLVGLAPGPQPIPPVFVKPHRRRIGYVQQGQALFPHLDVAGNLRYGEFALPRAERRRRFEQVAAELGLAGLLRRRPDELSGGERQRVALGRAVLPRPLLLLLDEPLSAVDAASRESLSAVFTELAGELGVPVLHVTHGQVAAPRERTVVYRVVEDGPGGRVVRAGVEAD